MAMRVPADIPSTDTIRFVLDGECIEVKNPDPTRTVLQYLREDLHRTGTKEGCAEGDCGACTVVVAELHTNGDELVLRPINSCIQFLPTLDGKELITVESLTRDGQSLHPVQQAMLDCHGSQCGFCTPGFVMSLFALYKTNVKPSRREIDDALAGNLCRCTGYRPIVTAATEMYRAEDADGIWMRQPCGADEVPRDRVDQLMALQRAVPLALVTDAGKFYAPLRSSELADMLAANPDATILAGGTDVGLWVSKQYRELDTLIYTGRVRELLDVSTTNSAIEIGAAVSFSDAVPVILQHYPQFEELFLRFASPPIRNAATLGGNIANGSPIGDSMPALIAADASLVLCSTGGRRDVSLQDFYLDYGVNDLRAGEFLERVRIPVPGNNVEIRSYKVSKRFDQDISAVCAGFALQRENDRVDSARVVFGGLAKTVRRATACEGALLGAQWNEATVERAAHALADDFTPISDMRASSDYRLRIAQNLLRRFYFDTCGETEVSVYSYGRSG